MHRYPSFYLKKPQQNATTQQVLKQTLALYSIKLSEEALARLWTFHTLMRQGNTSRDLTRIINFTAIVEKHYLDCFYVTRFIQPLPPTLLDIGTGAGFPGIMLKIQCPNAYIILAEQKKSRVDFLTHTIQKLQLKGIDVFPKKVVSASFTRPVDAVITRAVEPMAKTLLRTNGCMSIHGTYYFMKGPHIAEEIKEIQKRFPHQISIKTIPYTLPKTTHHRTLVVVKKLTHELVG